MFLIRLCTVVTHYVKPDTIRLLWAVHEKEDRNSLQTSTLKWHGKKWSLMKSVHLISPPAIRKPKETNVKHWDIKLDNVRAITVQT
ncbi:hypothetical protein LSTR_LSTR016655 [Laodelphax striatellus]|uniref:Uncharacterized protein n=1 Tax=Laodelphax striatellus TaxID=195883 RepID=A0A482WNC2_LAOST|nr:hypothetical protein LSTR_LSTR016655 [Laodelphax striatellus]